MPADKSQIMASDNPNVLPDPVLDYSAATPSTASTAMQEHSSLLPSDRYTSSDPDREESLDAEYQVIQPAPPVEPIPPPVEQLQERKSEPMKKTPLQAAAEDRMIALSVWRENADRDDDVRDALGRMLGWVERLVSDQDREVSWRV